MAADMGQYNIQARASDDLDRYAAYDYRQPAAERGSASGCSLCRGRILSAFKYYLEQLSAQQTIAPGRLRRR